MDFVTFYSLYNINYPLSSWNIKLIWFCLPIASSHIKNPFFLNTLFLCFEYYLQFFFLISLELDRRIRETVHAIKEYWATNHTNDELLIRVLKCLSADAWKVDSKAWNTVWKGLFAGCLSSYVKYCFIFRKLSHNIFR